MATAMFVETLDNFEHSKRLIHESRSFTFIYKRLLQLFIIKLTNC
jgi:hypothetical protein